ncbi:ABC transporter ATP-binding protein [Oerskovia turbata]|uniref:ABC transporter ATP-binding protein n=1 Tax=Oerskovia turbata TaxID=1713 RepID=A0A4Q1KPT9_9CELL|nr:ABC transporter ATP-binding protein [Oerskovia turbata]RXR22054.1 ABC transporter ATP-binding protein [Oerskovia turbata]RXR31987.1 ABC transporter ATP-binding protein [Oerskovia turbata]TGJ96899.1 ABC transporter ATP-binding protein [Actinotalea fermentans ATCC 43279 = JCM 9966 = DSM 3133]
MSFPSSFGGGSGMRTFRQDSSVAKQRLHRGTVRRILAFARPYKAQLAVFLVLIALNAAAGAVTPLLFKSLIDNGITAGRVDVVVEISLVVAGIALVSGLLSIGERWFSARVGEGLIFDLRTAVFDHVQRMPLAFFSRTRTGALVQRLNGDVLGAQQAFTSTLSNVFSNLLTVVFVLAAMLSMSWELTLIALALLPVFVLPARWVGRKLAGITRESYALNADAAQMMNERFNVAGAHLVKIFGRPEQESATYAEQAGRVRDIGVTSAMYATVFRVALTTVASVAVAIVYGLGGVMAIRGTLTVGVVVALTAYLARLYGPLTALSNVQVDVMTALVSFERVLEVLDLEPSVTDAPDARDLSDDVAHHGASLALEHVTFRYPGAADVSLASLEAVATVSSDPTNDTLTDVSFDVPAGAMVAVVGPSGAGKTTISQLVTRMYDPTGGSVRIAGRDLREVTQRSLQDTVGVVSQEAHLFHDTIAGNLRYARPDATDAELWTALRQAHVADLVDSLPAGLETVVGDRGYRLSGGERQRLAIARLFLKAPALVVLDEATAHLDSESEAAVQLALDAALDGRTSLVIAHRLSTIRQADMIVVLDQGRVVATGTHTDLLLGGGLYAELYRTQFATDDSARPTSDDTLRSQNDEETVTV